MITPSAVPPRRHRFGTFGGVFTPSILTILGVVMFLRAGFVVGEAGVFGALVILAIAEGIVILTALSVAAISTNTPVRGGGAYFLISRALGPGFGGAIGIALFLAQGLSVPFYILGFSEALSAAVPAWAPHPVILNLGTATVLFLINVFGANFAIRTQYLVMALLALSIFSFLGGAWIRFDPGLLQANLGPAEMGGGYGFWGLFAIYFPAVTGIMAGINMSGDLRDPGRSLVRGTFAAIAVGGVLYLLQIVLCGGSQTREQLIGSPYATLLEHALWGTGFLVAAGVYAASLSSAMGSLLGAPRVLQALGRDRVMAVLAPFAKGARGGDEPMRGLLFTYLLTVLVLVVAATGAAGNAFNLVATIVTMFFLATYGIINLAAFVEAFSANPSFRPRFGWFHWGTALAGTLGCLLAMILIDAVAALIAAAVLAALLVIIKRRAILTTYGDARRGFYYSELSKHLLRLRNLSPHPKNWRPTILILSGNPHSRLNLVLLGVWMEGGRGIVTLAQVLTGEFDRLRDQRIEELDRLQSFIRDHDLGVFPEVIVAHEFDEAVRTLIQAHSIGPIKPNLVMMGWPHGPERIVPFVRHLIDIRALGRSAIVVVDKGLPKPGSPIRVDIWWRGKANGSLMIILAYLLTQNWEWANARLRVLRAVDESAGMEPARKALRRLIGVARVEAETEVVLQAGGFPAALAEHSRDAGLLFLGFEPAVPEDAEVFYRRHVELLRELPTTILVNSTGDADLLA